MIIKYKTFIIRVHKLIYVFLFRDAALGCLTSSEWSECFVGHCSLFMAGRKYCIMLCLYIKSHMLVPPNQCACVFQWGENKIQMWHGWCSLPVLPAPSDRPAGHHNGHVPWSHTACQPDWRPAGWVLHISAFDAKKLQEAVPVSVNG